MDARDTFGRRLPWLLLFLGAASWAAVYWLDTRGLLLIAALWVAALPLLLRPLAGELAAEWPGVLFVFLVGCYGEVLDGVIGWEQRVSFAILLVGAIYLARRHRHIREVLRSPFLIALAIFLAQEVASAFVFAAPLALRVASSRVALLLTVVCGAVLVRRRGGEWLMPAIVVVAALMSIPVMVRELDVPDLLAAGQALDPMHEETRARGFWAQPNNAGVALSFALAFALMIPTSRRNRAAICAALGLGLLLAGSRGAFAISLLVAAVALLWNRLRRGDATTILSTAVVALGVALFRRDIGDAIVRVTAPFEDSLPALGRLQEVILAVFGSTQELVDDDSSRLGLAAEAWRLIGERPLFGRGTANFFTVGHLRSHVQFLEVLGQNGFVGGALYGLMLVLLIRTIASLPGQFRFTAMLACGAWLLTHFDNHNMVEYRFMVLPLAWVVGIERRTVAAQRAGPGARRSVGARATAVTPGTTAAGSDRRAPGVAGA